MGRSLNFSSHPAQNWAATLIFLILFYCLNCIRCISFCHSLSFSLQTCIKVITNNHRTQSILTCNEISSANEPQNLSRVVYMSMQEGSLLEKQVSVGEGMEMRRQQWLERVEIHCIHVKSYQRIKNQLKYAVNLKLFLTIHIILICNCKILKYILFYLSD